VPLNSLEGLLRQIIGWREFIRSVTTGVSAVSLNPDLVTKVRWWEHPDFETKVVLEAAELVAFDVLEPALRSRGGITQRVKVLYQDHQFRDQMKTVFAGDGAGCLVIRSLSQAWQRIDELERLIRDINARLDAQD